MAFLKSLIVICLIEKDGGVIVLRDKFKPSIKFALLLMVICLAFSGCDPALKAKYVDSAEADKNMKLYMSEVDKLMSSKGYNKSDRLSGWPSIDYMEVYELDNGDLLLLGTTWYEGEESFFVNVCSSSNELLDVSAIYPSIVLDILSIVSNYNISEEYLNEFCDNAKYDDKSGNYVNDSNIDRSGYYDLSYITRQNGSVVHESMGEYNTFFLVRGLTKTGLACKTGDGSMSQDRGRFCVLTNVFCEKTGDG